MYNVVNIQYCDRNGGRWLWIVFFYNLYTLVCARPLIARRVSPLHQRQECRTCRLPCRAADELWPDCWTPMTNGTPASKTGRILFYYVFSHLRVEPRSESDSPILRFISSRLLIGAVVRIRLVPSLSRVLFIIITTSYSVKKKKNFQLFCNNGPA